MFLGRVTLEEQERGVFMDKFFPLTGKVVDVTTLVMAICSYAVVLIVCGILRFLLGYIPLVRWVVFLLCGLVAVYCLLGIVLAILRFAKII